MDDTLPKTIRPSHWNYLWYYITIILIPVAIIKRSSTTLRIFEDSITIEKGWLSKQYTEVHVGSLRSVSIHQSFNQRLLGIGDLLLSTSGESGYDVQVEGIRKPQEVKDFINQKR